MPATTSFLWVNTARNSDEKEKQLIFNVVVNKAKVSQDIDSQQDDNFISTK